MNIKNSIYELQLTDESYYFIGFRIVGKENNNDIKIDYNSELQIAIDTVRRNKDRNLKVAIVTLLDPAPGSAILFYAKKDKDIEHLINEAILLKSMIESIAPHVTLEPISFKVNPVLPLPKVLGSVIYTGYIGQKKFDVKTDHIISGDYDIELGNILESSEIPIGIRSNDVFRHVGIFGSTGSGKSNTAALLSMELKKKGFDVIILDWHGEYKNLLRDFNVYDSQNFLVLNPIDTDDLTTMDIAELMGDALELTEPQKFLLYLGLEVLNQMHEFSFKTLLQVISANISDNTFMQRDVKFALTRKIIMLFSGLGEKLISSDNGYTYMDLGEKLRGGNIIDLSFIRSIKLRKLYALMILRFLLEYAIETRNKDRKMFIVIEEAQNYFNQMNTVISRALQEIRKFNVGLCIVSQSPSNVDQEVIKNTSIKIIHSIKSNIDKKVIADSLSLDKEGIQLMDKLDIGEALLVAPNLRKEVLIKVKKVV
ncbi:ATP-binding protein [Sulfurisphaera javensis]